MNLKQPTTVAALAALALVLTMCARPDAPERTSPESEPLDSSGLPDLEFGDDEDDDAIGIGAEPEADEGPAVRCGGVAHVHCAKGYVCRLDAQESSDPQGTCIRDPRGEIRRLRGLGERCGGIAGFECASGLACKIDNVEHTDPMGTCVPRGASRD